MAATARRSTTWSCSSCSPGSANHPQIWDGEPASFSINLSIGALEDEQFLDGVAAGLKTADIPPESIGFEITEFACVQCKPQVQRFVAACEKLGCFVVLDNFTFDSDAFALLAPRRCAS